MLCLCISKITHTFLTETRSNRLDFGDDQELVNWRNAKLVYIIMAALCNRAGHYIFVLWFLSFFLSIFLVFPRLISAAADLMSTILRHMVWP